MPAASLGGDAGKAVVPQKVRPSKVASMGGATCLVLAPGPLRWQFSSVQSRILDVVASASGDSSSLA
jgi:hypothetical protein